MIVRMRVADTSAVEVSSVSVWRMTRMECLRAHTVSRTPDYTIPQNAYFSSNSYSKDLWSNTFRSLSWTTKSIFGSSLHALGLDDKIVAIALTTHTR
jgi:hypothetical protein